MKTNIICCLAVVGLVCAPARAQQKEISQGIVSTGRVLDVSRETGVLTLRSQQAVKTLVFRGLQTTPVYFSNGRRATFADIEPGQPATLYYIPSGRRWIVSRIIIPEADRPQSSGRALTSTQPTVPPTRVGGGFSSPRVPNT